MQSARNAIGEPSMSRLKYFFAHGDWRFMAAAIALLVAFVAIVRFVHV
jgi:hypothetical protein